jgi:hypothetical protein
MTLQFVHNIFIQAHTSTAFTTDGVVSVALLAKLLSQKPGFSHFAPRTFESYFSTMEDGLSSMLNSFQIKRAPFVFPTNSAAIRELAPFTYTRLPSGTIRLLQPESTNPALGHMWRIETVKINEGVKFDALSYTWGWQDMSFPISLNGRCFHVHNNLYTALPYLARRRRKQFQRRLIWIDALCINQEDKEEVAQQVAQMHEIYEQAKMVWVWLGLCKDQSRMSEAIAVLDHIACGGRKLQAAPLSGYDNIEADMSVYNLDPNLWDALFHLLGNPWYHRVWV